MTGTLQSGRLETIGCGFLDFNLAISSGNLFFRRSLFERLGGFADLRYNHDWDFCLRATLLAEPVFVPRQTYGYRIHEANTITESVASSRSEAQALLARHIALASDCVQPENPLAPTPKTWNVGFYLSIARIGKAALLPPSILRDLATQVERRTTGDAQPADHARTELPYYFGRIAAAFSSIIEALPARPLISVLLPTYNTPLRWLRKCIESVLGQIYPHWQLCIADDASSQPQVAQLIENYAARDARIRFCRRTTNGHISAATNSALAMATGEFVTFLDHDDELTADALYWVARELCAHPDAGLIYSDEDKIDEVGFCSGSYYKPDWNPELLRGQNFVCHLATYRTDLVRGLGGLRTGLEGAQDWDLALRAAEALTPGQIRHVPRVLYHWRQIEGSTARGSGQKAYARAAQLQAVQDHYTRLGRKVSLTEVGEHWLCADVLADPLPKVLLLIDGRGIGDQTLRDWATQVLATTDYGPLELRILRDSPVALPDDSRLRTLTCTRNLLPGQTWAAAVEASDADLVGVFVHRCWPTDAAWLKPLVGRAMQADCGLVAPKIVSAEGRIVFAGTLLGVGQGIGFPFAGLDGGFTGPAGRAALAQNFQALAGGFFLTQRRHLGSAVGAGSAMVDEIELSLALAKSGQWNVWLPQIVLVGGDFSRQVPPPERIAELRDRWPEAFAADPAYNPALSRSRLFEPM